MANKVENKNKLFNTTSGALRIINESLGDSVKYILEGIFAELGVMNTNHRIYTEEEYLKHLSYLREDVKQGSLLGELDHPEDRFEVKLKEASHRIVDIWYDQASHMVMGKIELLETPNGMIARSLVDMGIPLHISSRAAGTINKDNTVSIQQIYTYDLVAKPGFAKAVLHRVNESAETNKYSDAALSFLKHSEYLEGLNTIVSSLMNEGFYTDSKELPTTLRKEAAEILENKDYTIDMNELSKHINEEEVAAQADESSKSAEAAGVPTADMSLDAKPSVKEEDEEKPDEKAEEKDAEKSEEEPKDEKDEKDEEKSSDYEIIDVKAFEEPDEKKEDEEGEEKDKDDDNKEGESDEEKDSEEGEKKEEEKEEKTDEEADESKDEPKPTDANKLFDKKNELESRTKKFDEQFEKLMTTLKTKNKAVTESQKNVLQVQFPFTAYMTESSLEEFSKLSDNKKRKVRDYLCESSIVNTADIDNAWRNGLNESVESEPVWLASATPEYRKLYFEASEAKRNELNECAKYINFTTKADIDTFWGNSELKTMQERRMINEAFENLTPNIAVKRAGDELPYSMENVMKNIALYS